MSSALRDRDPHDVRLAATAPEPLRAFNDAGVLTAADVQVARALARLGGVEEDAGELLLAFALAVRAPRLGHVLVDLATIRGTVAVDTEEPVDLGALPWPEPEAWAAAVARCPLVSVLEEDPPRGGTADARPLHLAGTRLYLDRYWREERAVAADLRDRAGAPPARGDVPGLERLFPDPLDARARDAAEHALRHRLTIVAGGPGTGKTTTIARALALLVEQAATPPLIALCAWTGKAAARLQETVREEAAALELPGAVRASLLGAEATTLVRLLGARPESRSRYLHDSFARLAHDVVVVDEASMLSLAAMARLLEAIRPDARLVLVGDPDQLASIEAGAVLGDLMSAPRLADSIVVLDRVHRYGAAIDAVAAAIRRGDGDGMIAALARGSGSGDDGDGAVTWIDGDPAALAGDPRLAPVRDAATAAGRATIAAALAGDDAAVRAAVVSFKLLCAHRRGPHGVSTWNGIVESWLAREIEAAGGTARDYPGRPLLVLRNEPDLRLFNGDLGAVVRRGDDQLEAVFAERTVRPNQLGAVDTVYAMTVHKSQGSQFGTAAVVLPPPSSRILTRELLYTGVTRARDRLIVVGTEASLRAALARPATRASGLAARLG
jgi:exodeoxyribonuclease V alpha subunit